MLDLEVIKGKLADVEKEKREFGIDSAFDADDEVVINTIAALVAEVEALRACLGEWLGAYDAFRTVQGGHLEAGAAARVNDAEDAALRLLGRE